MQSGVLADVPDRLETMLPQVSAAISSRPTPVTVVQILVGLSRCRVTPEYFVALDSCAERLSPAGPNDKKARLSALQGAPRSSFRGGSHDLSAMMLVRLSEALAANVAQTSGSQPWKPSDSLLHHIASQLDMKRYDLPHGALGRAALALEAAHLESGFIKLEPHDRVDTK